MIRLEENKEEMQKGLDIIYKWVDKNLMEMNEEKFEHTNHRTSNSISVIPYEDQHRKRELSKLQISWSYHKRET